MSEAPEEWDLVCLTHLVFPGPRTMSGTQQMLNKDVLGKEGAGREVGQASEVAKASTLSLPLPLGGSSFESLRH